MFVPESGRICEFNQFEPALNNMASTLWHCSLDDQKDNIDFAVVLAMRAMCAYMR